MTKFKCLKQLPRQKDIVNFVKNYNLVENVTQFGNHKQTKLKSYKLNSPQLNEHVIVIYLLTSIRSEWTSAHRQLLGISKLSQQSASLTVYQPAVCELIQAYLYSGSVVTVAGGWRGVQRCRERWRKGHPPLLQLQLSIQRDIYYFHTNVDLCDK